MCGGLVKAAGVGGRESKKASKSARGQAAALSLPALSKMKGITSVENSVMIGNCEDECQSEFSALPCEICGLF